MTCACDCERRRREQKSKKPFRRYFCCFDFAIANRPENQFCAAKWANRDNIFDLEFDVSCFADANVASMRSLLRYYYLLRLFSLLFWVFSLRFWKNAASLRSRVEVQQQQYISRREPCAFDIGKKKCWKSDDRHQGLFRLLTQSDDRLRHAVAHMRASIVRLRFFIFRCCCLCLIDGVASPTTRKNCAKVVHSLPSPTKRTAQGECERHGTSVT